MFQTPPPSFLPPELLPYLSEPSHRPTRHAIFDLNPLRPVHDFNINVQYTRPPSPTTPSPVRKRKDISPLSSIQGTPHVVPPPSTPTSPSRKVVRVQSPLKDDGPAVNVEILEREYSPIL